MLIISNIKIYMNTNLDTKKLFNTPEGIYIIKKMASSVCWSYDHMLNEIKTNPAMLYEYKKNIHNYEQHSKTDL